VTFSETDIEMKADALIRELDELIAIAADPDRRHLIISEALAMGMIYSRASLLQSFLIAAQVPTLKMVSNNG